LINIFDILLTVCLALRTGLDGLVKVLRSDVLDIKISWARDSADARHGDGPACSTECAQAPSTTDGSVVNPHKGLISLFEDGSALDQMNNSSEDPMGFTKFLSRFGASPSNRPVTPEHANLPTTVADLCSFKNNFRASFESVNCDPFDILKRLDPILKQDPILIAGGAVLRALTGSAEIDAGVCPNWANGACDGREGCQYDSHAQERKDALPLRRSHLLGAPGDVDIFVCTTDVMQASQIAERIFLALTNNRDDFKVIMRRGAGVIDLEVGTNDLFAEMPGRQRVQTSVQVKIVLRLYESPAEVLLVFDVDCCCLGFDGDRVWALPRAVRAIQYGTNLLNPLHAWPSKASYEFRVVKYSLRGYSISVPGLEDVRLDLSKILDAPLSKLKGCARLLRLTMALTDSQILGGSLKPPAALDVNYWHPQLPQPPRYTLGGSAYYGNHITDNLKTTLQAVLGELE